MSKREEGERREQGPGRETERDSLDHRPGGPETDRETSPGSESSGSPQNLLVSGVLEGLTLCQGRGTRMAHVPS